MATLQDYLKECEMFQYSKENFELVKEAAEINVGALYIESQQFMLENAGIAEGVEAGYMVEAADEASVKLLAQKAGGKKEKWAAKAKSLWARIVAAWKRFWGAIIEKYKKIRAKAADVKANLARVKITDEMAKEIGELVDRAVKQSQIPISDKQHEGFKKVPKNVIVACEDGVKKKLAAAICNDTIDLVINNPGQFALALSEGQLKSLFKLVSDNKVLAANADALGRLKKVIEDAQTHNLKKGISVTKETSELEDLLKYINDSETKLAKDISEYKPAEGEGVGDVTTLFANAKAVSQNSIKLYTAVIRFQEIVQSGLDAICKKAPKADTIKGEVKDDDSTKND